MELVEVMEKILKAKRGGVVVPGGTGLRLRASICVLREAHY